jgi:large subunit ribosomal protein L22
MRAVLRQVRISPRKASVIAGLIRNLPAEKGLETLHYMSKKGAEILYKLLFSAVSNAKNNFGKSSSELFVSEVLVSPGPTYRRGQSHSKGRVTPLLKRTSHITIQLSESQK